MLLRHLTALCDAFLHLAASCQITGQAPRVSLWTNTLVQPALQHILIREIIPAEIARIFSWGAEINDCLSPLTCPVAGIHRAIEFQWLFFWRGPIGFRRFHPIAVNFDEYCQQKAAPDGSSTYYALRRAAASRQPLLTALYALRRELEETAKETSDPTIGRTKHAWWQKELASLFGGEPVHPVTKAIAAHRANTPVLDDQGHESINNLVDGFGLDLDQARYLDWPDLRRYLDNVGGAFALMIARATAHRPGDAASWAMGFGSALMLAERVAEIGEDARHGRIYIPIDELQRFHVTAADLINRKYSDAFTELMRFQTGRARDALNQALAAVPADERSTQRVLRSQAALSLALLDEIERENFQVLHQRIALTPIRKLWISWRVR
jgi:phytoene synthase